MSLLYALQDKISQQADLSFVPLVSPINNSFSETHRIDDNLYNKALDEHETPPECSYSSVASSLLRADVSSIKNCYDGESPTSPNSPFPCTNENSSCLKTDTVITQKNIETHNNKNDINHSHIDELGLDSRYNASEQFKQDINHPLINKLGLEQNSSISSSKDIIQDNSELTTKKESLQHLTKPKSLNNNSRIVNRKQICVNKNNPHGIVSGCTKLQINNKIPSRLTSISMLRSDSAPFSNAPISETDTVKKKRSFCHIPTSSSSQDMRPSFAMPTVSSSPRAYTKMRQSSALVRQTRVITPSIVHCDLPFSARHPYTSNTVQSGLTELKQLHKNDTCGVCVVDETKRTAFNRNNKHRKSSIALKKQEQQLNSTIPPSTSIKKRTHSCHSYSDNFQMTSEHCSSKLNNVSTTNSNNAGSESETPPENSHPSLLETFQFESSSTGQSCHTAYSLQKSVSATCSSESERTAYSKGECSIAADNSRSFVDIIVSKISKNIEIIIEEKNKKLSDSIMSAISETLASKVLLDEKSYSKARNDYPNEGKKQFSNEANTSDIKLLIETVQQLAYRIEKIQMNYSRDASKYRSQRSNFPDTSQFIHQSGIRSRQSVRPYFTTPSIPRDASPTCLETGVIPSQASQPRLLGGNSCHSCGLTNRASFEHIETNNTLCSWALSESRLSMIEPISESDSSTFSYGHTTTKIPDGETAPKKRYLNLLMEAVPKYTSYKQTHVLNGSVKEGKNSGNHTIINTPEREEKTELNVTFDSAKFNALLLNEPCHLRATDKSIENPNLATNDTHIVEQKILHKEIDHTPSETISLNTSTNNAKLWINCYNFQTHTDNKDITKISDISSSAAKLNDSVYSDNPNTYTSMSLNVSGLDSSCSKPILEVNSSQSSDSNTCNSVSQLVRNAFQSVS